MENEEIYEFGCSLCGATVGVNDKICPQCGADLSDIQYINNDESKISSGSNEIKKVRGWLLFFCIGLTFITPIVQFWNIYLLLNKYSLANKLHGISLHNSHFAITVEIILSIGLLIFSVYAGLQLWRIQPNTIRIVKSFFIFAFIRAIIEFLLTTEISNIFSENRLYMEDNAIIEVMHDLVYILIWYTYFISSKRVKNTFPDAFKLKQINNGNINNQTPPLKNNL